MVRLENRDLFLTPTGSNLKIVSWREIVIKESIFGVGSREMWTSKSTDKYTLKCYLTSALRDAAAAV